jgi:8-oxo-dGTP pyrophosphatase MutT (NUDIX family)
MGERIDYLNDPATPKATSVVPSANVIVVNDQGEILMIRRTDNGNWAVPGGGMDLGESITETAVRETREETGIMRDHRPGGDLHQPGSRDPLHQQRRGATGVLDRVHCPAGGELRASSESSEPRWVPPEAVRDLQMHPSMRQRIDHYLGKLPGAYLG